MNHCLAEADLKAKNNHAASADSRIITRFVGSTITDFMVISWSATKPNPSSAAMAQYDESAMSESGVRSQKATHRMTGSIAAAEARVCQVPVSKNGSKAAKNKPSPSSAMSNRLSSVGILLSL
jgi:hypothetical protein